MVHCIWHASLAVQLVVFQCLALQIVKREKELRKFQGLEFLQKTPLPLGAFLISGDRGLHERGVENGPRLPASPAFANVSSAWSVHPVLGSSFLEQ